MWCQSAISEAGCQLMQVDLRTEINLQRYQINIIIRTRTVLIGNPPPKKLKAE